MGMISNQLFFICFEEYQVLKKRNVVSDVCSQSNIQTMAISIHMKKVFKYTDI